MATDHASINRLLKKYRKEQEKIIPLERAYKRNKKALKDFISKHGVDLAVTLNSKFNHQPQFEEDLLRLTLHLNRYAFGRQFRRGEVSFKTFACLEDGMNGTNLHCHMIISGLDKTRRTDAEIIECIEKQWCWIIRISRKNNENAMYKIERIENIESEKWFKFYLQKFLNNQRFKDGQYMVL